MGEYLLRKVEPKEFSELKRQEQDIINSVMKELMKFGNQEFKEYKPLLNIILKER